MKLIDTDIAIDHFHGHRAALNYLEEILTADEVIAISVVTLTELMAGMRPNEDERTEKLLRLFTLITVDEAIGRKAGEYLNRFGRSHHLELGDALIAASAFATGAELITRNIKHYPMEDIHIISPYERGH